MLKTGKTPRIIPILRDALDHMKQAQLPLVASSLAYTTILSIVPLLAVSFAIFQAFGGLQTLGETIEPFIVSNLAEGVSDDVVSKIESFVSNAHAGAIGITGLIGLLFTSMSMLLNIEKSVNRMWQVPLSRSLAKRITFNLLFVALGPIAFSVALGAATSAHLPLSSIFPSGTGIFLFTALAFFVLYKWVPHTRVRPGCAAVAGILNAAVFSIAQRGFKLYTSHLMTYSKIYGSLGAVPILLLWIYIVWFIVLGGAAFTAALQKRAA